MINYVPLARPQRKKEDPLRSIDVFYDEASNAHLSSQNSAPYLPCTSLHDYYSMLTSMIPYWIIFIALGIANVGDATEISSLNFCLSNDFFSNEILEGDFAGRGATLAAAIFLGMLIGGIVTGVYGDHVGRRPTLMGGLVIDTIAGIGSALSPNFQIMAFFRFAAGLGVGTIFSSLIPLATETAPPSKRGIYVTFVSSFFTIGTIFVAFTALHMFGGDKENNNYDEDKFTWRRFLLISTMPCLVATIMVYMYVPESARYLALQNRLEEACREANRVADSMCYKGPMLEVEEIIHHYQKSKHQNTEEDMIVEAEEEEITSSSRRRRIWQIIQEVMITLLKPYSKELRAQTFLLQLLSFSMSFGAGLNTWINAIFKQIDLSNIYMHSIYFALANIPGTIAAGLFIDRMGRKPLLVSSMILSSISLWVFANNLDNDLIVTISACSFHGFLVIARCTFICVNSELFPTEIRGTGVGICAAVGRLASMAAQFVNGSLVDRPNALVSVSSISILSGACFSMFLVDMSNQPLSDGVDSSSRHCHASNHLDYDDVFDYDKDDEEKKASLELVEM